MSDTTSDIGSIYRAELQRRGVAPTYENLQRLVMATRRGEVQLPDLQVQGIDPSVPKGLSRAQPSLSGSSRPSMPIPPMPPSMSGGTSPSMVENVPPAGGASPAIAAPGGEKPSPITAAGVTSGDPEGSLYMLGGRHPVGSYGPTDPVTSIANAISGLISGLPSLPQLPSRPLPGVSLVPPRPQAATAAPPEAATPSPGAILGAQDTRFMQPAPPPTPVGSPGAMPAQIEATGDPNMVGNTGLTTGQVLGGTGAAAATAGLAALAQSILRSRQGVQPPVAVNFPPPPTMPPRQPFSEGRTRQDSVLRTLPGDMQGPPTAPVSTAETPAQRAALEEEKTSKPPPVSRGVQETTDRANQSPFPAKEEVKPPTSVSGPLASKWREAYDAAIARGEPEVNATAYASREVSKLSQNMSRMGGRTRVRLPR